MNSLVLVACLEILIAVLVQLGSAVHNPEVHKICLFCPLVSHPHECTTFTEIWPHERCSTELLVLLNGSIAYTFGYETATDCIHSDSLALPDVSQRRMSSTNIPICHECCTESLCNRRLCGIHENNNTNLACLVGMEVRGLPLDTSITYCQEGEQCYAARTYHARPNHLNYGCASQVVCDRLCMGSVDDGSLTHCHACCSQDGCNAHICDSQLQDPQETTTSTMDTTQSDTIFTDCWDLRNRGGFTEHGIYDIYPAPAHSHIRVRCDMTTDGGGWTILQRRYDGSLSFTRTFQEYEEGFGDVTGEHWLGLDWIHILASQGAVQLRVDMCTFTGQAGYAVYDDFFISGQNESYRLHTPRFRGGNIRDYLTWYKSTLAFQATGLCATAYGGGWWYNDRDGCFMANLNGGRYNSGLSQGIAWYLFNNDSSIWPSLRSSEMKIRPVHVTGDSSLTCTCPT